MTTEQFRLGHRAALAALLLIATPACQGDTAPAQQSPEVESDLTIGATGDEVRTLHEYLTKYGYFPNPELAAQYPRWQPAVNSLPADPAVFDTFTASAVEQLQINFGLLATGIVDAPTRALLKTPRCGVPDGVATFDASDKFSLLSSITAASVNWTWQIQNTPPGFTIATVQAYLTAALSQWAAQSSLQFTQSGVGGTNSAPHIIVDASDLGGFNTNNEETLGQTSSGGGCCPRVTLNTEVNWSSSDMQSVLFHELGHALGLDHSPVPDAVMFPSLPAFTIKRTPTIDDNLGISTLWDTYQQNPNGAANDVGAGADGSIWVIGQNPMGPADFGIFKYNGSGWDADVAQGGAVRIAVDPTGVPWVVTSWGGIFKRTTNSALTGSWQPMPGFATDIGIGANGSVWVVGTTAISGGFGIYKWNETNWNWDQDTSGTGATRIAVSPSGKPWIVNSAGNIKRKLSNSPFSGSWEQLSSANVKDIAVGPGPGDGTRPPPAQDGSAWHVNGTTLYVWDEQGGTGVPNVKGWRIGGDDRASGSGSPRNLSPVAVSVGANAQPVVLGSNGAIYMPLH